MKSKFDTFADRLGLDETEREIALLAWNEGAKASAEPKQSKKIPFLLSGFNGTFEDALPVLNRKEKIEFTQAELQKIKSILTFELATCNFRYDYFKDVAIECYNELDQIEPNTEELQDCFEAMNLYRNGVREQSEKKKKLEPIAHKIGKMLRSGQFKG